MRCTIFTLSLGMAAVLANPLHPSADEHEEGPVNFSHKFVDGFTNPDPPPMMEREAVPKPTSAPEDVDPLKTKTKTKLKTKTKTKKVKTTVTVTKTEDSTEPVFPTDLPDIPFPSITIIPTGIPDAGDGDEEDDEE